MISRDDGTQLDYIQSISQSIADILTTPIGSRVMRREYGSLLPDLADRPIDDVLILQAYSAIYSALLRWEDRIIIESIEIEYITHGVLDIRLDSHLADISIDTTLDVNVSLIG
ncbi:MULTISPECIES: GPW/gp25 family protein [unclassified Moraxella]|uniref:GPW/gp25 family protein n=1 Tax=unclassified Moraxella TaxID=2685852 RepID=UPI00359DAF9F